MDRAAHGLYLIGLSHHEAPLSVRERLVLPVSTLRDSLREIVAQRVADEAAILSTCNRTEIYCTARDPEPARRWLSALDSRKRPEEALPYIQVAADKMAALHAFKVASGLDSMVIGEPQITGQFKSAFAEARGAGTVGAILNRLCDSSLAVAKKIRTETPVSEASLSMPALSVKLARRIFPDVAELRVLFVGAGEMIEIGMGRFAEAGAGSIAVANRTASKSVPLARRFGAGRIPFEQVPDALPEFDVVYTCTSSAIPLVGKGALERALIKRKRRPMLLIDLGVPRDVEPEAGRLEDIMLYTVDDLGAMAAKAGALRESSLAEASAIAEMHSRRFLDWMRARPKADLVAQVRGHAEDARAAELERALRELRSGKPPEEVVENLSKRLAAKLLHPPTRLFGGAELDENLESQARSLYGRAGHGAQDGD